MATRILTLLLALFSTFCITIAQNTRNVLFLGNSYTAANNLPMLTSDLALSAGDTMTFDSNTPGGFTFQGHSTNASSLGKIATGAWDFVVLQEQSQLPSFPLIQVMSDCYPYAAQLNQVIKQHNPCAETMFFMTWGRKNGDASNCAAWPPVCTYEGMDSLLYIRYMMMADSNDAVVTPVGAVWRHIRSQHPDIELYEPDESHPSYAGSYAAACSFYATVFRKDPTLITMDGTLPAFDASRIRAAAKTVVYDSLSKWFIGSYDPVAGFTHATVGATVSFTNLSQYASQYHWEFGDGTGSTLENPVHTYTSGGNFVVQLTAAHCGKSDTTSQSIPVTIIGTGNPLPDVHIEIFPNPAADFVIVRSSDRTVSEVLFTDLSGRILHPPLETTGHAIRIDLSGMPPGAYIILLRSPDEALTRKMVLRVGI